MSFGLSVGDFIAVSKLINDIRSSLQSVGGARSEYQELDRQLQSVDSTLRRLNQLDAGNADPYFVESIKCTALNGRRLLEMFLHKIRKFEKSLGIWAKPNVLKSTASKMQWTSEIANEVERFQTFLSAYLSHINILLAQHGFEQMDMHAKASDASAKKIQEKLDSTHEILENIKKDLPTQTYLLRGLHQMLGGLYQLVCGEVKTSLENLYATVTTICVSTQQIYMVVLEIRDAVSGPDTRWTHFQTPLVAVDSLGHIFQIPSEYDYGLVAKILYYQLEKNLLPHILPVAKDALCCSVDAIKDRSNPLLPNIVIRMAASMAGLDESYALFLMRQNIYVGLHFKPYTLG